MATSYTQSPTLPSPLNDHSAVRPPSNYPMLPTPQPQGQPTSLTRPSGSPTQPTQVASTHLQAMPSAISLVENGRRYTLDVVQQPQRARMCGFGDKDRRPITPPPCVRLIITDEKTGKEIDMNDICHNMFVLNVDLWSEDGTKEVNLVRHATASPQISAATSTSYQQVADGMTSFVDPMSRPDAETTGYGFQRPSSPSYSFQAPSNGFSRSSNGQFSGPSAQTYPPNNHGSYPPSPNGSGSGSGGYPGFYPNGGSSRASIDYSARPTQPFGGPYGTGEAGVSRVANPNTNGLGGMFTRNLIGSLAASAFRLTDPDDKIGIWFVLQDLSVRTEGSFRLRFSFVNVGTPGKTANGDPANENSILNTGKAPVLASCYSEVFTVYSAKKFPGVVESTALSRCFATQGIKIPIRKDGMTRTRDEYNDD